VTFLSTTSTNSIAALPEPATPAAGGPVPATLGVGSVGLSVSAWMKIGIVALLMTLLFRFNLSRLWLKTNPITGQDNWGHAFFIPLIGLYYLYVHREELIAPRPISPPKGSIALLWGIFQLGALAIGSLLWAAFPKTLDWLEAGINYTGFLTQYHGWRLAGLYLFLPYLIGTSGAALLLPHRPELARKLTDWAAKAWPPLGAWLMLALAAWGAGFFVYVVSQGIFGVFRVGLALMSLAGLAAVLWAMTPPRENGVTPLASRMLDRSAAWLGGFILGWGVLFSLWGIFPGQNDFFKDVGMVVALFGVVLLLSGWGVMRVAWFPILFLFCGLPWPDQVYSWVAGPLQHLAAAVAARFLTICNIPSNLAGNKIVMHVVPGAKPRILDVEEACAGLRSLMTFVTLAAGWAFVFMSSRPLWHRLIQTASAVPIAIFCNVVRVSCTGLTDKWWGHEFSEGFAHRFVGLLLLVPAFFLILLVGWVLDNLFIEEADDEDAQAVAGSGKPDQRGRVAAKPGNKMVVANRAVVVPPAGAVRPAAISPQAGSGQAPARRPGSAGFRPPVLVARPPGSAGPTGAPAAGSTGSTSSPQASSPHSSTAAKATQPAKPQPAKPPAARRPAEKPAGKPGQTKEGL